jgi:hypothetical protein
MKKRPLSVTVISWVFIAVGIVALIYHLLPDHIHELKGQTAFPPELLWVCLVRMIAVVCGVFMLRGLNWARWLLVVWIAFHVLLSFFHSVFEVVVHGLLFGVVTGFLFSPRVSHYFRESVHPLKKRAE